MASKEVFISYAWGGESEKVANELDSLFSQNGIGLVRDKTDLGFKGLIKEFMQQIGQGNLVVIILSDNYLKSKNCMFELMEIEKKGEFFSRIFPIVLSDANIYDSLGILSYLKYWDQKIKELNVSIKELENLADTRKVQEDINLYTDIRGAIDDLAGKLSNMNTLTLDLMRAKKFNPLFEALEAKLSPAPDPGPKKKEGSVLYHIPSMMQVDSWIRCTVRLAWDEILLKEDLKIPEEERVVESIRLGNIMQVYLGEARNEGNFEIHAISNEEQFITEDDFTEWLFDVKPKNLGQFTLILRITLIQIIEGKERKKDLVLEREVTTEIIVPQALPKFETAESRLPVPDSDSNISDSLDEIYDFEDEDENTPTSDDHRIYPELSSSYDFEKHPKASPIPPGSPPKSKTKNPKSIFKKILPYAASLAGMILIALVFFPSYKSQDSSPSYESISEEEPHITVFPDYSIKEEQVLFALSLNATGPQGEEVTETMVFMIRETSLDSLLAADLGNYSLEPLSQLDSLNITIGEIKEYSIKEIQDSIKTRSKNPIRVGNQLIPRDRLRINRDF
jgi:hypothetical protein